MQSELSRHLALAAATGLRLRLWNFLEMLQLPYGGAGGLQREQKVAVVGRVGYNRKKSVSKVLTVKFCVLARGGTLLACSFSSC